MHPRSFRYRESESCNATGGGLTGASCADAKAPALTNTNKPTIQNWKFSFLQGLLLSQITQIKNPSCFMFKMFRHSLISVEKLLLFAFAFCYCTFRLRGLECCYGLTVICLPEPNGRILSPSYHCLTICTYCNAVHEVRCST